MKDTPNTTIASSSTNSNNPKKFISAPIAATSTSMFSPTDSMFHHVRSAPTPWATRIVYDRKVRRFTKDSDGLVYEVGVEEEEEQRLEAKTPAAVAYSEYERPSSTSTSHMSRPRTLTSSISQLRPPLKPRHSDLSVVSPASGSEPFMHESSSHYSSRSRTLKHHPSRTLVDKYPHLGPKEMKRARSLGDGLHVNANFRTRKPSLKTIFVGPPPLPKLPDGVSHPPESPRTPRLPLPDELGAFQQPQPPRTPRTPVTHHTPDSSFLPTPPLPMLRCETAPASIPLRCRPSNSALADTSPTPSALMKIPTTTTATGQARQSARLSIGERTRQMFQAPVLTKAGHVVSSKEMAEKRLRKKMSRSAISGSILTEREIGLSYPSVSTTASTLSQGEVKEMIEIEVNVAQPLQASIETPPRTPGCSSSVSTTSSKPLSTIYSDLAASATYRVRPLRPRSKTTSQLPPSSYQSVGTVLTKDAASIGRHSTQSAGNSVFQRTPASSTLSNSSSLIASIGHDTASKTLPESNYFEYSAPIDQAALQARGRELRSFVDERRLTMSTIRRSTALSEALPMVFQCMQAFKEAANSPSRQTDLLPMLMLSQSIEDLNSALDEFPAVTKNSAAFTFSRETLTIITEILLDEAKHLEHSAALRTGFQLRVYYEKMIEPMMANVMDLLHIVGSEPLRVHKPPPPLPKNRALEQPQRISVTFTDFVESQRRAVSQLVLTVVEESEVSSEGSELSPEVMEDETAVDHVSNQVLETSMSGSDLLLSILDDSSCTQTSRRPARGVVKKLLRSLRSFSSTATQPPPLPRTRLRSKSLSTKVPIECEENKVKAEGVWAFTPLGVVQQLCSEAGILVPHFHESVLNFFRFWCTPADFLLHLMTVYDSERGYSTLPTCTQFRVVNVLKLWMTRYWRPPVDTPVLPLLTQFIMQRIANDMHESIALAMYERTEELNKILGTTVPIRWRSPMPGSKTSSSQDGSSSALLIRSSQVLDASLINPLDYDNDAGLDALAQELTVQQMEFFDILRPFEVIRHEWKKMDACDPAVPSAIEAQKIANAKLSRWIKLEILHANSEDERIHLFAFFVQLAQRCSDMRNYSSGYEITMALDGYPVRNLRIYRCEYIEQSFQQLVQLYDVRGNFYYYRQVMSSNRLPKIPIIGVYLNGIIHFRELSKAWVAPLKPDQPERIDVKLFLELTNYLKGIENIHYSIDKNRVIFESLTKTLQSISLEDDLVVLSKPILDARKLCSDAALISEAAPCLASEDTNGVLHIDMECSVSP